METEARKQPGVERVRRNDRIAVYWEPRLCIHVANCIRRLPQVFDPQARPWVAIDPAPPDAIVAAVAACPTGALHVERLDGGPQEPETETVTIAERSNGPLFVRGRVRIAAHDGQVIREDTRLALCRCGGSQNEPFCDGTHRAIGFRTAPEGEPRR